MRMTMSRIASAATFAASLWFATPVHAAAQAKTDADASTASEPKKRKFKLISNTAEFSVMLGVFIPSARHELYEESYVTQKKLAAAGFVLGGRIAYMPLTFFGIEIENAIIPIGVEGGGRANIFYTRLHGLAQLPMRWAPFVLGGGGIFGMTSADDVLGTDVDRAWHYGVGLKYYVLPWLAARIDFRHLLSARRSTEAFTNHFELNLGVAFVLGRCRDADKNEDLVARGRCGGAP